MLKVQIRYYLKIKFGLAQINNIYLLIYQLRSKSSLKSIFNYLTGIYYIIDA